MKLVFLCLMNTNIFWTQIQKKNYRVECNLLENIEKAIGLNEFLIRYEFSNVFIFKFRSSIDSLFEMKCSNTYERFRKVDLLANKWSVCGWDLSPCHLVMLVECMSNPKQFLDAAVPTVFQPQTEAEEGEEDPVHMMTILLTFAIFSQFYTKLALSLWFFASLSSISLSLSLCVPLFLFLFKPLL